MKKLLLSFLCVLGLASAASAETYTIKMDKDIFGSATADITAPWTAQGFTFTAEKADGNNNPAYNKAEEVRMYANNTLTIAANGANITSISFAISAQGLKRFAELTPSVGAIEEQYVNPLVWNGSAASVTFKVGADSHGTEADKPGQFDFTSVTITTDGAVSADDPTVSPEDPEKPAQGVYTATTTVVDGTYLLYASDKIATPIEASKSYGYIQTIDATVVDGTITTDKANEFTIKAVEGGYTIQGPDARYYYMKGTYNSFNLSAERVDGDVWTIEATDDGAVIITNVAMKKAIQFDTQYNSYGAYDDVRGVYPTLYVYTKDAEGGDDEPVIPEEPANDGVYTATTTIATGNYLLYASDKIATPIEESKSYGYIQVVDATVVDGTITTAKANQFTITAVEGGYTIQGPDARYYYMKGTYNSFNLSAERVEGDVWTIEATDDGAVIITNVAMKKSLQFDTNYNSYGAYEDVRGVYPTLYVYTKDAEGGEEPPVEPELPEVDNLVALYDFANNDKFEMTAPLTVVYVSGAYVYVFDSTSYGLIYKNDLGLKAGDVIAEGWKGHVSIYNELVELVPDTDITTKGTAEVPDPLVIDEVNMASVTLMPYNQNLYIKLVGVTFADATPDATNATFTGTMTEGEEEYTVTFRNPFKLAAVEAGTYDVVAFVSLYKTTVQINPVEFITTTAIENVAIEDAPVRYFNLQGIEVANPESGNIYIRVQGNKAVKVIK